MIPPFSWERRSTRAPSGAKLSSPDLPDLDLTIEQASWLAPARSWLLQRIDCTNRHAVLDMGCGYGTVTAELARVSAGRVVALDRRYVALDSNPEPSTESDPVCSDAAHLPFADGTFDLVFCQLALLWMPFPATLAEIWRVMRPGGVLIALEPDYGGMIEYPGGIATRNLWVSGLERAGADPFIGRKLPGALSRLGFFVQVNLFNELVPPSPTRFDLLGGLPLSAADRRALARAQSIAWSLHEPWQQVAHLPFVLITATRPRTQGKAPDARSVGSVEGP